MGRNEALRITHLREDAPRVAEWFMRDVLFLRAVEAAESAGSSETRAVQLEQAWQIDAINYDFDLNAERFWENYKAAREFTGSPDYQQYCRRFERPRN